MKQRHVVRVEFGEHIAPERIDSMRTMLAMGGDVTEGEDNRTFLVETVRDARHATLKKTLVGWEQHGFVRWVEVS